MPDAIFFAHANGFPSATYSKLFAELAPDYQVQYLPVHGHDPRFKVNDNWGQLVAELIHHLQQQPEPVWGVGHSLGGVLHYQAALQRPDLYRGVVMLDSPLLGAADRVIIRAAKRFGLIDRITPAGRTLGRREVFSDATEARQYFAAKRLFSRFDPECLDAYIEHGLKPDGEQLRLRFCPQTEISIYRTVPHTRPLNQGRLQVPLALMRGEQSRVVLPLHAYLFKRAKQGPFISVAGGHMFPLEHPQSTAEQVKQLLQTWASDASQAIRQS